MMPDDLPLPCSRYKTGAIVIATIAPVFIPEKLFHLPGIFHDLQGPSGGIIEVFLLNVFFLGMAVRLHTSMGRFALQADIYLILARCLEAHHAHRLLSAGLRPRTRAGCSQQQHQYGCCRHTRHCIPLSQFHRIDFCQSGTDDSRTGYR